MSSYSYCTCLSTRSSAPTPSLALAFTPSAPAAAPSPDGRPVGDLLDEIFAASDFELLAAGTRRRAPQREVPCKYCEGARKGARPSSVPKK
mmetsp:Transcript_16385/g.42271  ORF Transcript_16385/g.42271 Transcript_16385/m.42271 type:complete len:91 (+) Transcript_16385:193-465(+)|eukprot:CAMPEP_0174894900 /NCGR_PEP_ID=MMETSP0167-20121228/9414_1 /TAXON_ID=38298 /ORGANISM="Rhodella maculata, Strain CCMP736" /LENGTH=90 /DNA_ID=CAMNT_0016134097 /DNA_START=177 /DNA_END=449 /DNA_ORIENTATION=+